MQDLAHGRTATVYDGPLAARLARLQNQFHAFHIL